MVSYDNNSRLSPLISLFDCMSMIIMYVIIVCMQILLHSAAVCSIAAGAATPQGIGREIASRTFGRVHSGSVEYVRGLDSTLGEVCV